VGSPRRRKGSRNRKVRSPARRPVRRYGILIEKGPTSFGISVPDLPGWVAFGATRSEAIRLIRGAIRMHLDSMERPNAQDLAEQHNVFGDTLMSPVPLPKWLRGKARHERDKMS